MNDLNQITAVFTKHNAVSFDYGNTVSNSDFVFDVVYFRK